MPTYEYRCPKGHEFELVQRMSDEPGAACPTCGEEAERLLSAGAGFLFKGEGFYITDSRSESYRKAAKAEKGEVSGEKPGKEDASKGGETKTPSSGTDKPAKVTQGPDGGTSKPSKKAD